MDIVLLTHMYSGTSAERRSEGYQRVQEPSRGMKKNVLIVDDEPEICLLLQAILAKQGIAAISANSLAQARQNLQQGNYDGVFLDVNLPDGKGYELIPELKVGYPKIRVIVISAMDQERTNAMQAGTHLFLPKPLDLRTILASLKEVGLMN